MSKTIQIWQMTLDSEGKAMVAILSNLRRHTATVNVVRFSKNGELLASAGDDTAIVLWKLSDVPTPANNIFADDEAEEDKESWVCHKTLRGHLGDVADLCWSKDNRFLVSGSVDNSAIVWDVVKDVKLAMFNEHKSYVQGVAFDPLGTYIATLSADRSLRLYNVNSKNCVNNVSKMVLPSHLTANQTSAEATQSDVKPKPFRIFHDDSLRSFFRRLEFSPDGQLLITPAGCMELGDGKVINASFVFARGAFSKPAEYLPSIEKTTTVIRVNPQLYQLRPVDDDDTAQKAQDNEGQKVWEKHKSIFCLPYRIIFAIATEDSVILYDTQQTMPVGLLKNIHYHQISDLSWTSDGKALIVSSTDGFCTIATFEKDELGIPYRETILDHQKSPFCKVIPDAMADEEKTPVKSPSASDLPFSKYSTQSSREDKSDKQKSPATKTTPGKIEKKVETKINSPATNKDAAKVTNMAPGRSDLTDDVSQLRIVESNLEKPKDSVETNEQIINNSKSPKTEEAPKKRRVQITTLVSKK